MSDTMRAMVATDDGVEMIEVRKPTPGKGEVRVRVITSAVNPAEQKVINGELAGRFIHAKTSPLVLGWDFAGTIDAIGEGVNDMDEGAAVWGHLAYTPSQKQGTFAEYVTVPRDKLAIKPGDVPYHVTAAAATVTMTALQSLRDLGELGEGGRALIIGAGGGVGSVSVGIGKRLGSHITGVCSTKDVQRVKTFGADAVIDRKKTDPFDTETTYDVVFDTPAVHSFGRCSKILRSAGTYVTTLPGLDLVTGMLRALFTTKRCRFIAVVSKRDDLKLVGSWLSEGLEVPIDSRHKIADLDSALKRQTERSRVGRVVVEVADSWPS